jgi:choline dehydrogenase-like flavoprotein
MGHEGSLVVGVLPVETYQGAFGPVVSSGIMQFYEGSADRAGAEMMLVNVAGPSLAERAIGNDGFGDDLLETVGLYGNSIGLLNTVEMLPREENRITLDESKTDNHGNPVPDVQVEPTEFSRKGAEKTVEVATNLIEELGGNVIVAQGSISERDELIEDIKGGAHPMGGTRMGTDPTDSVVDPNLQTHDLDNLYISGGGVFVTGGAANPTLTIMALSLKAADDIHEQLSG